MSDNEKFAWACPYCGHSQMVGQENLASDTGRYWVGENEFGEFGYVSAVVACLNPKCKRVTVNYSLVRKDTSYEIWRPGPHIQSWGLLPESSAKLQPDYIPKALRDDYAEACRIRDLSPKASATLARRCLQGMIRDFSGISKARLIDEINVLREAVENGSAPLGVTGESVEAIDHVRGIGNIGAHMETDVNVIVEIDPGEAQALIDLVEMLFKEWYIQRKNRADSLAKITAIGAKKHAAKAANKKE